MIFQGRHGLGGASLLPLTTGGPKPNLPSGEDGPRVCASPAWLGGSFVVQVELF